MNGKKKLPVARCPLSSGITLLQFLATHIYFFDSKFKISKKLTVTVLYVTFAEIWCLYMPIWSQDREFYCYVDSINHVIFFQSSCSGYVLIFTF